MTANLLKWSQDQYNHLPWRKDRSLYRTLVSEIMLQQTTVGTVKNHFDKFIQRFPTIESLAGTSEDQMSIAWKGLGYYRRAKNLRSAAQEIVEKFQGAIPVETSRLLEIKGIGPYTAGAIRAIGADLPALAIDANIERVLARYYALEEQKGLRLHRELEKRFEQRKLFKELYDFPRAAHEALMDVGRVYCQARKAECIVCPLNKGCQAYKQKKAMNYPVVIEKKKEVFELELLRLVVREKKKILGYKKESGQWLEGQIEPPTFILKSDDPGLVQYPKFKKQINIKDALVLKTGITKYKITNYILEMSLSDFLKIDDRKEMVFYSTDQNKVNLATSTIKILKKIEGKL